MEPTLGLPKFLPRWLCFGVFWILLSVLFASQAYWSGYAPWPAVLWMEAAHWLSWGIVAPLVFWLCRRLYRGERTWTRYTAGLLLGAIVISLLQPALTQLFVFMSDWLQWLLSVTEAPPPSSFLADLYVAAIKVAGFNLPIYAGLILGWHAMTYYTQLRDRQVEAMELESLLHQAQLQTLRSQLNPHFLFNTLHSIAELVHRNPTLAEQLILRLGELLRQALRSSTEQEVALAEELDFIRGYVEIEQMRLGDERLQVTWEIAPEALAAKVPSLILQPLIENAIRHGVTATTRPGVLAIRAGCDDGYLHLQVRDTGPGLPQPGKAQAGIGLSNTQARLRRLYGAAQRFALLNDNGLVVNIQIPLATRAGQTVS